MGTGEGEGGAGSTPPLPGGLHHLTRHWLPEQERGGEEVLQRFGADSSKAAEQMIKTMGQRQLREAFLRVYGSPTASFNNQWLRRKLCEALGLRAAPSGRGRGQQRRPASRPPSRSVGVGAAGGISKRGRVSAGGGVVATAVGRAARAAQQREQEEAEAAALEEEATAALHETADALLLASCELESPPILSPLASSPSRGPAPAMPHAVTTLQQEGPSGGDGGSLTAVRPSATLMAVRSSSVSHPASRADTRVQAGGLTAFQMSPPPPPALQPQPAEAAGGGAPAGKQQQQQDVVPANISNQLQGGPETEPSPT